MLIKSFFKYVGSLLIGIVAIAMISCAVASFKLDFIVDDSIYATIDTNGSETISMPKDPTKEGYTFDGWYWDKDIWKKEFSANSLLNTPLSSDMEVYAHFIDDDYPIGTTIKIKDSEVRNVQGVGDVYTIFQPNSQVLFNFEDYIETNPLTTWSVSTDVSGNNTIANKTIELEEGDSSYFYIYVTDKNDQHKTYILVIHKNYNCTVSFNVDGGSYVAPIEIEEGNIITDIPTTSKYGYTFKGWDYDFKDPITTNKTINAIYEANEYTITYDVNGGDDLDNNKQNVVYDNQVTLIEPNRNGYVFQGWFNNSQIITDGKWKIADDVTLKAKWEAADYTISYILNDGENDPRNVASFTCEDEHITLYDAHKDGYSFIGWKKGNEFITTIDPNSKTNYELEAAFEIIENDITYHLNGGTNDPRNPEKYNYNQSFTLLNPNRNGYSFEGWYSDELLNNRVYSVAVHSTGNIEFYAKWSTINYQINYHLDGGTNALANPSNYNIETSTIILENPAKDGFEFNGWYDNESCIGDQISTISHGTTGNSDLYAKWSISDLYQNFRCTYIDSTHIRIDGLYDYSISELFIPSSITNSNGTYSVTVAKGALSSCSNLETLTIPTIYNNYLGYIFGANKYQDNESYVPTSLHNLVVSEGCSSIPYGSFYRCSSLQNVTIPNSVETIDFGSFAACSGLVSISLPFVGQARNASDYFNSDDKGFFGLIFGSMSYRGATSVVYMTPYPNSHTIETYIPSSLRSVTFTDPGDYLDYHAFYNCTMLEEIVLEEGLTSISYECFRGCSSLETLVLPNTLTSVEWLSFQDCPELDYNEYDNAYYLGNTDNPYLVLVKAKNGDITSCTIHSDTKIISYRAFYSCSNLSSVSIPQGVVFIGDSAFSGCNSLNSISLPEGITSVSSGTFSNCHALGFVVLHDGVTYVNNSAFYSCDSLTKVYYHGSPSSASHITVNKYNGDNSRFTNAKWYYYTTNGSEESLVGNWWYYDTDGTTIIEIIVS